MSLKKRTLGAILSAGITFSMVSVLGTGIAAADPAGTTCTTDSSTTPPTTTCTTATPRTLALVGSETTTPIMQALAEDAAALAIGGTKQVDNWNATNNPLTNTQKIQVRPGAACNIVRPNGSSAGRTALLASQLAADGCLQAARSSSNHLSGGTPITTNPDLTFIPFAREAISFAITNTSNFSKNLTNQQLIDFFNCTTTTFFSYKVMLPQNGSGTRSYWIGEMYPGQTIPNSGPVTGKACIQNGADELGAIIEEHDGRKVNNNEIVPMSVAQWASQTAGVINPDVRGATRVGQIDGTNPFADNFAKQRDLYNVFNKADVDAASPPAGSAAAAIKTLFVGGTAQICTNANAVAIREKYFLRAPSQACGDTSNDTL